MTSSTPSTPPVVYLGPSAPQSDILKWLPDAIIRPPAKRGDLYRDRLLRFSVLLLIDGVFAQNEAVPPREVVDVLEDGARVIGAASMGALRACDCHIVGAEGVGTIYRLFRHGVINSEDEVAVGFNPERAFPAATVSLVQVRIALHHAVRGQRLSKRTAHLMFEAARDLHYLDRTWRAIWREAGCDVAEAVQDQLRHDDPKRSDASRAAAMIARRLGSNPAWGHRPRAVKGPLGRAGQLREQPLDLHASDRLQHMRPGFVVWMMATGRAKRWLEPGICCLENLRALDAAISSGAAHVLFKDHACAQSQRAVAEIYDTLDAAMQRFGESDAEWLQYIAAQRSHAATNTVETKNFLDMSAAARQITAQHGYHGFADVLAAAGKAELTLVMLQKTIAHGLAVRRANKKIGMRHDRRRSDP